MSVIEGTVIDAQTKKPLTGVSVTAADPLLQIGDTVSTDAQGDYAFADLPPGTYTLKYEMDAYRAYTRDGIELHANRTIRVNVELLPDIAGPGAANS